MPLLFGTGGIPLTTKKMNVVEGVKRIKELGLDSMELEFVYQTFLDEAQASELKEVAGELDVALTVHGSYYINLAAKEKDKWHASINRIIKAAKIGELAGAKSITFHAGFLQGRTSDEVYKLVKVGMEKILDELEKENVSIRISPELTGKSSQWGDLEDLIQLVQDLKGRNIGFCFDFAHKHARAGGGFNTKKEFDIMLGTIKKELGQTFLGNMHIHISGINYGEKGEKNHLTLLGGHEKYVEAGIDVKGIEKHYKRLEEKARVGPADLEWKALLQSFKEFKVGGIVVCESPNLEEDALFLKKTYQSL